MATDSSVYYECVTCDLARGSACDECHLGLHHEDPRFRCKEHGHDFDGRPVPVRPAREA